MGSSYQSTYVNGKRIVVETSGHKIFINGHELSDDMKSIVKKDFGSNGFVTGFMIGIAVPFVLQFIYNLF